jgi:seryl-tRNA synthetase
MLDIKFIRQNPQIIKEALKKRNSRLDLDVFLRQEEEYRQKNAKVQELRAQQNKISKEIEECIKQKKDPAGKIGESKLIKKQLEKFSDLDVAEAELKDFLLRVPNIPHESVPEGGPKDNKVIKETSKSADFDFPPKDHIQLAEDLDIVDFKRSTKLSGTNFILLKGQGALLERALINFMLDIHVQKNGYTEIMPPVLALPEVMEGTGQLPNLKEDMYYIEKDGLYLIPTAEVPLTNIHRCEILNQAQLPIKYTAYTPCFRREAGSYGADTRGLMRVHQFNKVELVKLVVPEDSYQELEWLLEDACKILDLLQLPYRLLSLASGDISFASAKTYDIELYAPGIDKWLEVSSCSNFEDFQARRANIRYKDEKTGKNRYVHTLNGSGLALPRLVAAILENYQERDGSIRIPEKLKPYFDAGTRITK